jgi:Asp-tRNA(Asn)/Glu-tRNA(Gln) amidotransferase A subunit family amidase
VRACYQAALGTHLKCSIIRAAGYCANYAIKPNFGSINRGGGHLSSSSGSHLGVHAGSLQDAWEIAWFLSQTAGPDAGYTAIPGDQQLPAARKPNRLLRMFTPGWEMTPESARKAFEELLQSLGRAGVEIVEPDADPRTITLEADFRFADRIVTDIAAYEMRWPLATFLNRGTDLLSAHAKGYINRTRAMSIDDYHKALAWRSVFRARHMATAGYIDGFISLSSSGPAPLGLESVGESYYQTPASIGD